jgi:hypothetical protein
MIEEPMRKLTVCDIERENTGATKEPHPMQEDKHEKVD